MAQCLNPIYMICDNLHPQYWRDTRSKVLRRVPCGHCVNCMKTRQQKLQVRFMEECKDAKSLHLVTLTYDDKHLPFASSLWCRLSDGVEFKIESSILVTETMYLDRLRREYSSLRRPGLGVPVYHSTPLTAFAGAYGPGSTFVVRATPSLCREHVRLWIKSARVAYKRKYGVPLPDFKYIMCGEYGPKTCRPHYHLVFKNLTSFQVDFMVKRWIFGDPVQQKWQKCKLDVKSKSCVSAYLSKYIAKGEFESPAVKAGDVERPRFSASRYLGLPKKFPLRYYYCWDIFGEYDPDTLKKKDGDYLSDFELRVLFKQMVSRMSVLIPGTDYRFPLPDTWKKIIYYNRVEYEKGSRFVPKTVYRLLTEDLQYRDLFDRQSEFEKFMRSACLDSTVSQAVVWFETSKEISRKSAGASERENQKSFYSRSAF